MSPNLICETTRTGRMCLVSGILCYFDYLKNVLYKINAFLIKVILYFYIMLNFIVLILFYFIFLIFLILLILFIYFILLILYYIPYLSKTHLLPGI